MLSELNFIEPGCDDIRRDLELTVNSWETIAGNDLGWGN